MTTAADMPVETLLALYPVLGGIAPADFASVLADETRLLQVPAGTVLFSEGQPCSGFPMLLSGGVRVARGSPAGRSLELYHVGPGELCVVSTACLFGQMPLSAHGVTESDTELLHLSPAGFARWVTNEPFRRFVFGVFADRLAELMALAEAQTALGEVDAALLNWKRVLENNSYPRARVQYAELLASRGNVDEAQAEIDEVLADQNHSPAFEKNRNAVWIRRAKKLESRL
jgi:CRP-like cAMP-binding protein